MSSSAGSVNPPTAWTLTVNTSEDPEHPNTFVGTADDSLGFSYTAIGKHNANDDTSKFTVKGVTRTVDPNTVSEGAQVKLTELVCDAVDCTSGNAKIKVQGNKSQVELAP